MTDRPIAALDGPLPHGSGAQSLDDNKSVDDGALELQDQTNLLPTRQVIAVFTGITCALFCSLLDQTMCVAAGDRWRALQLIDSVATSLPTISRYFNDASISTWVGTAYLLTSTAVQPMYGRLSDIFGRKIVLLTCLTIFLFASLACALAKSMIQLIVFRAFQGIGGGGITTLGMIISEGVFRSSSNGSSAVSDVVSLRDRGKYQGIMGAVTAVSNSLGPIIGGILSQSVTWRWCFVCCPLLTNADSQYLNLPLTSLAMATIVLLLPLKPVDGDVLAKLKKVDVYGSVVTLAWACLILLGLSWAGVQYSWSSAAVLAPIVVGVSLIFVFIYIEGRLVRLPLIPLYIFKDLTVAASMATSFANGIAFYATLYYLPQYLQIVRGTTPIRSGVLLLPLTLFQTSLSVISGFVAARYGEYKWSMVVGFAIWTVGLGLMSTVDLTTPLSRFIGYQIITGVGAGQTFQTNLLAIQAAVSRQDMATATGCRNFLRMLGGTIALAACSTIVNNVAKSQLRSSGIAMNVISTILSSPTELTNLGLSDEQELIVKAAYGVDACFWFMVPMTGLSVILTLAFVRRVPLKRDDDDARKEAAKVWLASQGRNKGRGPDEEVGMNDVRGNVAHAAS